MSDLGFIGSTAHLSARSEPRARQGLPRPPVLPAGTKPCTCPTKKGHVRRWCITCETRHTLEPVRTFRGDHELVGRAAQKDPESRGRYVVHRCPR